MFLFMIKNDYNLYYYNEFTNLLQYKTLKKERIGFVQSILSDMPYYIN